MGEGDDDDDDYVADDAGMKDSSGSWNYEAHRRNFSSIIFSFYSETDIMIQRRLEKESEFCCTCVLNYQLPLINILLGYLVIF